MLESAEALNKLARLLDNFPHIVVCVSVSLVFSHRSWCSRA